MTLQHLDTVIAFAAVMLAASLLITAATQLVVSLLGLRGSNLRRSLVDLLETTSPDREAKRYAKEIARRVLRHPLVSDSVFSRFYIGVDRLPFVSADAVAKLQWAASGIPLRPWLLGALGGSFMGALAVVISEHLPFLDLCEYSDALARYVPVLNFCEHPWSSGAILGAVFVGLLSRWRLATSIRVEEFVAALEKISEPPSGTLPDPAQCAMLVIAGAAQSEPSPKVKTVSTQVTQVERLVQARAAPASVGTAVAVEDEITHVPAHAETRPEGLKWWFQHAMDRASQRFTLQARMITVALSLLFVFAAHLDAIHLFQTLSSDAQLRAQLVFSAGTMTKQAEQILQKEGAGVHARREGGRTVVPDVYRKAMAAVLQPPLVVTEPPKAKPHRPPRGVASPSASNAEPTPSGGLAMPDDMQDSPRYLQVAQVVGQSVFPGAEPPAKKEKTKAATPPKPKTLAKEREKDKDKEKDKEKEKEKPTAAPAARQDKATIEAKVRAAKALEDRSGFASREDAVSWLRATLDGDPAVETLVSAYDQGVNAELSTDIDKLIDHSASLKSELARSQFQLLPERWTGWQPAKHELPGLLVAVAFLSLGAPFWYNILKSLASLYPRLAMKQEQEHKRDKLA